MLRKLPKGAVVGEIFYDHAGHQCYYREDGSICVQTVNNEPSMTIQSEKDSCDVNKIVARFMKTGQMTNIRTDEPTYGDFSNVTDYHDALFRLQQAEDDFMTLPAELRLRFKNDPAELIDFLADEKNRAEAIQLGLVPSPQAEPAVKDGQNTPKGEVPANEST